MPQSRFWTRVFAVAGVALLLYLLARVLEPFLGPILWAALLSFLLFPVNRRLRGRLGGRRGLASAILTLGVTLGIVIPSVFLTLAFVEQATELRSRVSRLASRYQIEKPQDLLKIPALGPVIQWIEKKTLLSAADLQQWLVDAARHALELSLAIGRQVVISAVGAVVGLVLMLFILYFFFRDGDQMAVRAIGLVPLEEARKKGLVARLASVMRAVVFGSLATALIQGALLGLAFEIAGLPTPVVFGFLTALAALLPVGGTALVWVPAAIVLYAQGHPGRAFFMLIWGAMLVGSIDNFLRPLLISGRAEISTLPIFFGVMGGLAAFGPIGIFVGPLVIALALALLGFVEEAPGPAPAGS